MNRIILSFALAGAVAPLASSAHADSMGGISKALAAVSKASSGPNKSFIAGATRELRGLQAKHQLSIEQPWDDVSYVAQPKNVGSTVFADPRTVSVYLRPGYSASFRIDRHGSAIRHDVTTSENPFASIKTFSSTYSDSAGRPLSKIGGWLRWTMAKKPLY